MANTILALALVIASAAAAIIAAERTPDMMGPIQLPKCDRTDGYYSAGTPYAANVVDLISELRDKASDSPALFASGFTGEGEEAAFGVVVCRGDIGPDDCYDCVSRAIDDLPLYCNLSRNAAILYGRCYVRVAATDFMASRNGSNGGAFSLKLSSAGLTGFNTDSSIGVASQLLDITLVYTVGKAAAPLPRVYFGTGQVVDLQAVAKLR